MKIYKKDLFMNGHDLTSLAQMLQLGDHLSLRDCNHLLAANDNSCPISENLSCFNVRIVFTAHPTQFYSSSVLEIINKLRSLIDDDNINEIDLALQQLELEDLRAIAFVGSWSQLKQNVPGYYGIGTALQALVDDGRTEDLKELFRDVPFFKTLILNSMMSLSKCYFELTEYIAKDKAYTGFWDMLFAEYELSKKMVLLISGYSMLMEEEPVSRSSIEVREQIVLPLLVIQQYALQKIEARSSQGPVYEKIVERSLYGNINASRNSA